MGRKRQKQREVEKAMRRTETDQRRGKERRARKTDRRKGRN